MRAKYSFSFLLIFLFTVCVLAVDPLHIYNRNTISLHGEWNIIVDPYENGYYNYRWEAYDEQESGSMGYYGNKKMESPSDLIEYNFDKSPVLHVPGDWNTQDPKYYYYEGTIWYRKIFDKPQMEIEPFFISEL
ncbi:hypothetical protein ES708_25946 [subsurface metagenome]